jgi:hypothetical protein
MRFWLAVFAAAIADVVVFSQGALWVGGGALLAAMYLFFASFGAGWFAARRSALAGGLSVMLGAAVSALYVYLTTPPAALAGASVLDLVGWALRLGIWALPYAIGGALAGAGGGWLRGRALRRA